MLVGPPASGKSTLARRLAARLPAALVQSDAVRKALFPAPCYSPEEHREVFAAAHARLARLLRAGRSVVFDATNLEAAPRRQVTAIAAAAGARLLVARLVVADAVARERLTRRGVTPEPGDQSDADWAVYQAMVPRLEPVQGPHWVLNSVANPDALASLLIRRLRPGSRAVAPLTPAVATRAAPRAPA